MPFPLAIPAIVGLGRLAYVGYRAYQGYRAVRTVQVATTAAQAAAAAERARRAAQLAQAASTAQQLAQSKAREEPCEDCENPCAHLANGTPGSRYRGGAHGSTRLPIGDGLDSHHTPAAANSYLPREIGPAIQMDPADHRQTASYGRGPTAPYMMGQKAAVDGGNFMAAIAMDVADVRRIAAASGDPTKYDDAIRQMLLYAQCLKQNGIVR